MNKLGAVLFVCACLILAGSLAASADEGKEKEVSLSDVPAAARSAIEDFAGGGKIEEVKMEEEDGQVVYEAEIEMDGGEAKIEVTASGDVVESAVQVRMEDLPEPVKTTIGAFAAAGEVEEIMKELEGEEVRYEAEAEIGKMEFEIAVSPAGTVLEVEAKGGHHYSKADKDDDEGEVKGKDKEDDDDDGEEEDD